MVYRVADIAGAVSQADADNQRARLSDLQIRQGDQGLAQGSRIQDLQLKTGEVNLESAQIGLTDKRRSEAMRQIELTGRIAEKVIAEGGKSYPEFVSALKELGVPTDKFPAQYDEAMLQNVVSQSKAFASKGFQQFEGPRGSLLERNTSDGSTKQVVGPETVKDWQQPGYIDAQRKIAEAKGKGNKLPTSALKLQQEELDAIGTSSGIATDLAALNQQILSGNLKVGPVQNLISKGRNYAGESTENSRNFGTFTATLEKLRNDSLRLNKGVQTDGDAQRAWNENFPSINDGPALSQRLGEIQKINERGVALRKMNVDAIRSNFGLESMDTSGYQNQPSVLSGAPTAPANRTPPSGGVKFLGFE